MTEENTGNTKQLLYFVFVNENKELVYAGKTQDKPLTNMFQLEFTNTNFAGSDDSTSENRINTVINELQSNNIQPYAIVQQNNDFRIKYNELKKQIEIKDKEIKSQNSLIQEILEQSSDEKNTDSQVCKNTIQKHQKSELNKNIELVKQINNNKIDVNNYQQQNAVDKIEKQTNFTIKTNTNNKGEIIDNSILNKNPQNLDIEFFIPHKVVNVRGDGDCFYYALFHALKSKGVEISTIFDINNYNDNDDEDTFATNIRSFIANDAKFYQIVWDFAINYYDAEKNIRPILKLGLSHDIASLLDDTIQKIESNSNQIIKFVEAYKKLIVEGTKVDLIVEGKKVDEKFIMPIAGNLEIEFLKDHLKTKGYWLDSFNVTSNAIHTALTPGSGHDDDNYLNHRPEFYMFGIPNRILIYNDPNGAHFQYIRSTSSNYKSPIPKEQNEFKMEKVHGGKPSSSRRKMTREKKRTTKRNLT